MFLRKRVTKFLIGLILLVLFHQTVNSLIAYYQDSSPLNVSIIKSAIWSLGRRGLFRETDEGFNFELEFKLKFIHENFEHRMDFVESSMERMMTGSEPESLRQMLNKFHLSKNIDVRRRLLHIKALLEQLFEINKFKKSRLDKIAQEIWTRLEQQQTQKCRLDKIVYCSLEQNCGFGCHLHTMSLSLLIAYYWERTLIFASKQVPGMEQYEEIFLPIASSCRLHNKPNTTIMKEAFHPFKVDLQVWKSYNLFQKFAKDLSRISLYHRDPIGFISGLIMSYVMRFNKKAMFYKSLIESERHLNLTHPYVGVHIRRSDKGDEARFFALGEYMRNVKDFFEIYFFKHPEQLGRVQPTVYVASDDQSVFQELKARFVYNNSYTNYSSSSEMRYSKQGFESLLFDLHFLSSADHLVCTFSSSICRISYEFLVARVPDTYKLAKSLDIHFNNFDLRVYQIGVLNNVVSSLGFQRGDVIEKFVYSGHNFDGYHWDGWSSGKLLDTRRAGAYPSYKAKDFYHLVRPIASIASSFSLFL